MLNTMIIGIEQSWDQWGVIHLSAANVLFIFLFCEIS